MIKVLHFADTHIDIAAHGKRDPESGLPYRVLDFLKALDTIIDTAISEKVNLVLFAGDAYKDRTPVPTYQREWGKRIMRLSQAGIPTLLLVGNHDLSPSQGRANALEEFRTLDVPNIRVIDRPVLIKANEFENLPVQIMAVPWVSRSTSMADDQESNEKETKTNAVEQANESIQDKLIKLIELWFQRLDPQTPTIFLAHASVQGAVYGNERSIMLGHDYLLPTSLLKNQGIDYVALGHIHKAQNLNKKAHPPIIYPGSIERVDFGEINDEKYFVIAKIDKGNTKVAWHKLKGRKFIDCEITLESEKEFSQQILNAVPDPDEAEDAIIRVRIRYPKHIENIIDENLIREFLPNAFSLHIIRRPEIESRIRLNTDSGMESYTTLELLNLYWETKHIKDDREMLNSLAQKVMAADLPLQKE
ncbi:MAG: exonuclease SbcCD subunit D [Anaerolineaceae bacterium]|nr:exonuclease SbcCD subunit D [Anaerolineaceae bacterium]